jgi:NAD(P)H-dependent FMN reductase
MAKIIIVSGSNRQGRGTPQVAEWVLATAKNTQSEHEFTLVDLADYDLPFMQEAYPPQNNPDRQLDGDVKRWVETMSEADGYLIVTPEYNHSVPAYLKNALDTLDYQLKRKPVAIVSHGAIAGARANEHLRLIINSNLGAVPVPESVTLNAMPAFGPVFDDNHQLLEQYQGAQKPLENTLESLVWHTEALAKARTK